MSSGIDKTHFQAFCSKLTIPSKEGDESGEQLVPLVLLPTQLYALDEVIEGWNRGLHEFVILKCRQSLQTTEWIAFGLYWAFRHDGLVHNFIADTTSVRDYNRSLVKDFVRSLQRYPEWHQEIIDDNDSLMSFSNRSKIIWHVANKRTKGQLGQSVGMASAHGTELANWQDQEGAASMTASKAKKNPNRFFVWESRPGAGLWKTICKEAESGVSKKFIFIGWWRHHWYDIDPETEEGSQIYNVYWRSKPHLTRNEMIWVDGVKKLYGFEIRDTQIAWWRWQLREEVESKGLDEEYMYQQYPPLPAYAWRYGAKGFISNQKIIERETILYERRNAGNRYWRFNYGLGTEFNDMKVVEVDSKTDYYDLITFEDPDPPRPGMRIAISCDPSHGADEKSDDASIEVMRCHADQAVQIAEFCANEVPAFQLAWVVLWLAGHYGGNPLFNTELQGGGYELQNEIRRIQYNQAWGYNPILEKAFAGLEHYRWKREDQIRGRSESYHTKMGFDFRIAMMRTLQGYFERSMVDVRSMQLLEEIRSIHWTSEGDLEIPRPNHRVMAFGLCVMAYKQLLDIDLGGMKDFTRMNWEKARREASGQSREEFLASMLTDWRDKMIMQAKEKAEAPEPSRVRESLEEGVLRGWRTR
jgi:hypothetical protein